MAYNANYPRCWKKVSLIIRHLANGRCERCRRRCQMWELATHHLGTPYVNGRPGDPHDKHDIRRENLVALCWECHRAADAPIFEQAKHRREQHERHASLGVGTGLVVWRASVLPGLPSQLRRDFAQRSPVTSCYHVHACRAPLQCSHR